MNTSCIHPCTRYESKFNVMGVLNLWVSLNSCDLCFLIASLNVQSAAIKMFSSTNNKFENIQGWFGANLLHQGIFPLIALLYGLSGLEPWIFLRLFLPNLVEICFNSCHIFKMSNNLMLPQAQVQSIFYKFRNKKTILILEFSQYNAILVIFFHSITTYFTGYNKS